MLLSGSNPASMAMRGGMAGLRNDTFVLDGMAGLRNDTFVLERGASQPDPPPGMESTGSRIWSFPLEPAQASETKTPAAAAAHDRAPTT
jgi:hypothetical protein